jgi:hypothetical protein
MEAALQKVGFPAAVGKLTLLVLNADTGMVVLTLSTKILEDGVKR